MGWAVLLPGVKDRNVVVVSGIERTDGSAAAHDTEQTHVINALTLIGSTSNGVSCRSETDLPFPARGVWIRSRAWHKYFFVFCFVFFAVFVPGCFRVMFFIFVSVLWSSRSVGALRWGGMVGSLQFGVVPALCCGGFVL